MDLSILYLKKVQNILQTDEICQFFAYFRGIHPFFARFARIPTPRLFILCTLCDPFAPRRDTARRAPLTSSPPCDNPTKIFYIFAGALFGRVPNGDVSPFFISFRQTRGGMPACRSIPTKRRTSPRGAKYRGRAPSPVSPPDARRNACLQEHSDETAREPHRGEVSGARNPPESDKRRGDPSRARARVFCRALLPFGMTRESEALFTLAPLRLSHKNTAHFCGSPV